MKTVVQLNNVKTRIVQGLATQHPVKLLGVIALLALMITVTGLHFAPSPGNDRNPAGPEMVLVPGADPVLAGFTPNQQVEILGEMDDLGDIDATSYQPVLVPGAPAALAGFTPNQQVEILGEMDDFPAGGGASSSSVGAVNGTQVLTEDGPYAYLTLEEFGH